jgi:hypothetical protein
MFKASSLLAVICLALPVRLVMKLIEFRLIRAISIPGSLAVQMTQDWYAHKSIHVFIHISFNGCQTFGVLRLGASRLESIPEQRSLKAGLTFR